MSTGYRLVLPTPWKHVPLDDRMRATIDDVVEGAVARLPGDVPPDQRAKAGHLLREQLRRELGRAADEGAIDYYLPVDLSHGALLSASFVVSSVVPDAMAGADDVGSVLARLAAEPGAVAVEAGNTTWVRRDHTRRSDDLPLVEGGATGRVVDYLTAVPGQEHRWAVVTFSALGDGDPTSEVTDLLVELFDAIMTTWRWVLPADEAPRAGAL